MTSQERAFHEFAEFERLPVTVVEAHLMRDGFGERPRFRVLMAEWDGQIAGYAFFFDYYSTFEGRPGLFLEDIYVREQYRGKEIGKAMLARVAAIAREENCFGVRWQVLDWNAPAIEFYRRLGAEFLDEWKTVPAARRASTEMKTLLPALTEIANDDNYPELRLWSVMVIRSLNRASFYW